jgi:hypothetical protein
MPRGAKSRRATAARAFTHIDDVKIEDSTVSTATDTARRD